MNIVLAQFFQFCGAILIISFSNYLMIAIIVGTLVRYFFLQRFYRASSREVRRLESTYRSPLYTLISDCLGDSQCIRATRSLYVNLTTMVSVALDESLRVSLASCYCSQWLNIRLQCLGAIITASVGLLAILCTVFDVFQVSPGLLGLSLAMSFSLVGNLNGLVSAVTETEQEMISVERVCEYCHLRCEYSDDEFKELSQEPVFHSKQCCKCLYPERKDADQSRSDDESLRGRNSFLETYLSNTNNLAAEMIKVLVLSGSRPPLDSATTPLLGDIDATDMEANHADVVSPIVFSGVSMIYENATEDDIGRGDAEKYHSSHESSRFYRHALKDICLIIPGGSRVALCGPTGSGKSTLIRLLLGLNEYNGSLSISGTDIKLIPKSILRSQIVGVIPQDPFLFSGTIRSNLDPFAEFKDEEIIEAMKKSQISATFFQREIDISKATVGSYSHFNNGITVEALNYSVDSIGASLSVGQKQLLCLARCILRKTKILLVDEATSSLDPAAEHNLFSTLFASISPSCTVLIVCHNLHAVLPFCDRVIELEAGKLKKYENLASIERSIPNK